MKIKSRLVFIPLVSILSVLAIFVTSVILYQNCSQSSPFEAIMKSQSSIIPNNPGDDNNVSLQQLKTDLGFSPNLVENCLQSTSKDFNACIFWKNRIAQGNLSIPYAKSQSHAVKIVNDKFPYANWNYKTYFTTKSPNGDLENSTYIASNTTIDDSGRIGSDLQQALPDSTGKYNSQYDDGTRKASQIGTFYWANAQAAFMTKWTGTFYTYNKQAQIIIYQTSKLPFLNAGFSTNGLILMGSGPDGDDFGLDATILSHEAGHGNLFYANPSTISGTPANTVGCGKSKCCSSTQGCIGAIHEGQADYHAVILFEDSTAMGETCTVTTSGMSGRNVSENSNLNVQILFNQSQGEIHTMGTIYTSVWWEIRKKAKQFYGEAGVKNIDTIFTNHLALLNNNSTFKLACTQHIPSAAKTVLGTNSVGMDIYEDKYKSIVDTQCSRISQ